MRHEISDIRKDMVHMEERMGVKHKALLKDTHHEIKQLESRIVIKLGGIVFVGASIICIALPLTVKLFHVL